jgi:hypothetical protein
MRRAILLGAAALLVAGCGTESASFLISGGDVALTLERTKSYPWDRGWGLQMIVRNDQTCQRRHALKPAGDGDFRVEVFAVAPGAFVLQQGNRWYVTDLRTCELQQYQEPPPDPGTPVGAFVPKNGALAFVLDEAAQPQQPAAPSGGQGS